MFGYQWLTWLRKVAVKAVVAAPLLLSVGLFATGVVAWGGFNWAMELSNTESFCISCHVMQVNVYREYRETIHYKNRTGVRATCPDCHVPKEWGHKVVRKIEASNELVHWLLGTINTKEKFEARRGDLANHVWSVMRRTDSRECRNCHGIDFMTPETQKTIAGNMHKLAKKWAMTCIDCHKGIAHQLPAGFDDSKLMDQLHERIEAEKIACHGCHKGMTRAPKDRN